MEPTEDRPTERFSDRAEDYARCRPSYPEPALDAMLEGLSALAAPARLNAVDIAAGTGILSRLLADRGVAVTAVEPNAAMRAAARSHDRVSWIEGTAERTGVGSGTQDLATVAQAFHWFWNSTAIGEFRRLLRPGGRLAIVWNRRRTDDAFTLGYRQALAAIDAEAPVERSTFDATIVAATGHFANLRSRSFDNPHRLTLEDLICLAMSTSTVPRSGPRTDTLLRTLRALHAEHHDGDGRAVLRYRTDVFLWDRAD